MAISETLSLRMQNEVRNPNEIKDPLKAEPNEVRPKPPAIGNLRRYKHKATIRSRTLDARRLRRVKFAYYLPDSIQCLNICALKFSKRIAVLGHQIGQPHGESMGYLQQSQNGKLVGSSFDIRKAGSRQPYHLSDFRYCDTPCLAEKTNASPNFEPQLRLIGREFKLFLLHLEGTRVYAANHRVRYKRPFNTQEQYVNIFGEKQEARVRVAVTRNGTLV